MINKIIFFMKCILKSFANPKSISKQCQPHHLRQATSSSVVSFTTKWDWDPPQKYQSLRSENIFHLTLVQHLTHSSLSFLFSYNKVVHPYYCSKPGNLNSNMSMSMWTIFLQKMSLLCKGLLALIGQLDKKNYYFLFLGNKNKTISLLFFWRLPFWSMF